MTSMSHTHVASADGNASAVSGSRQQAPQRVPSRVRLSLIMMLGVYPIITALLYVVLPLTAEWAIWQITLVVVPMMVPMIVFGLTPFIQKTFGRFIQVPAKR